MAAGNLDSADLKGVARGGLIREDVLDRIFDISRIPLPYSDMLGRDNVDNAYTEWTKDRLQDQDLTNAVVDGSDTATDDQTLVNNERVGNHCQISVKGLSVSSRADASNTIGFARTLAYQVMRRQQELMRDQEGIMMTGQASVADDGNTTPGNLGGLQAWIKTNTLNGTSAGFQTGSGLVTGQEHDFSGLGRWRQCQYHDVRPQCDRSLEPVPVRKHSPHCYPAGQHQCRQWPQWPDSQRTCECLPVRSWRSGGDQSQQAAAHLQR